MLKRNGEGWVVDWGRVSAVVVILGAAVSTSLYVATVASMAASNRERIAETRERIAETCRESKLLDERQRKINSAVMEIRGDLKEIKAILKAK